MPFTKIYAQVLERQPYAYERKKLAQAEKDFLKNKIGVKRFLRILGHSDVYLDEFYHNSSNPKFIELCFKHFMGRAPKDQEEMHTYCDILMREGAKELITALLDSEEYRKHFGCFTVPPCLGRRDSILPPKPIGKPRCCCTNSMGVGVQNCLPCSGMISTWTAIWAAAM